MVRIFRVTVPVTDLPLAERFYGGVLGISGEQVAPGWLYFNCEGVILACYDAQAEGRPHSPMRLPEPIYLAVDEPLVHPQARARRLGAPAVDDEIRRMPTGEMGLRLQDPFGNALCLIDYRTMISGSRTMPAPPSVGMEFKVLGSDLGFERDFLNAAKGGELERVRELLHMDPALVDHADTHGVSALMHAAYKRKPHVVAHLRSLRKTLSIWEASAVGDTARAAGLLDGEPALLNRHASDGFTPLGLACFFGKPDCVRLLIERGADVNLETRNVRCLRPIHSAVSHEEEAVADRILSLLLNAGVDLHARQENGYTALHLAADRGAEALVRRLLDCGAVPAIKSDGGRSAADLARARGHVAIVALLQRFDELGRQPLREVA